MTKPIRTILETLANIEANEHPFLTAELPVNIPKAISADVLRTKLAAYRQFWCSEMWEECSENLEAIIEKVGNTRFDSSVKSVVAYKRAGDTPCFEIVPTGKDVEAALWARPTPQLFPLVVTRDSYERKLVIMASSDILRVIEVRAGAKVSERIFERDEPQMRNVEEWDNSRLKMKTEMAEKKFIRETLKEVEELYVAQPRIKMTLVGTPRMLGLLSDYLPKYRKPFVVATKQVYPNFHVREILDAAIESTKLTEGYESLNTVARLHHSIASGGLGVGGQSEVLESLELGSVDTLVISSTYDREDVRESMIRQALMQHAEIETVDDPESLSLLGGVGALLRYSNAIYGT